MLCSAFFACSCCCCLSHLARTVRRGRATATRTPVVCAVLTGGGGTVSRRKQVDSSCLLLSRRVLMRGGSRPRPFSAAHEGTTRPPHSCDVCDRHCLHICTSDAAAAVAAAKKRQCPPLPKISLRKKNSLGAALAMVALLCMRRAIAAAALRGCKGRADVIESVGEIGIRGLVFFRAARIAAHTRRGVCGSTARHSLQCARGARTDEATQNTTEPAGFAHTEHPYTIQLRVCYNQTALLPCRIRVGRRGQCFFVVHDVGVDAPQQHWPRRRRALVIMPPPMQQDPREQTVRQHVGGIKGCAENLRTRGWGAARLPTAASGGA